MKMENELFFRLRCFLLEKKIEILENYPKYVKNFELEYLLKKFNKNETKKSLNKKRL